MKAFTLLAVALVTALSVFAEGRSLRELDSHLFTNAIILWQVPTARLPKSLWVYQRLLPTVFSERVISNAIVLGSLQSKGFPKPSTNDFFIMEDKGPYYNSIAVRFSIFGIEPGEAFMYYSVPHSSAGSGKKIPNDETILTWAEDCATLLGLDLAKLVLKSRYTHLDDTDQNGQPTRHVCGRGIFLSRQLDGVSFFSNREEGDEAEGFSIEFGGGGQIRFFSLRWSDFKRSERQPTLSTNDLIHCVRAHEIIVLPNGNEEGFFARLDKLASATKLIITNITPYYCEFVLGEMPTNDAPCKFATPLAELEAVAEFGKSSATVRMLCPIIPSEARRMSGK